jgi:putative holliday junction resolvase
MSINGRLLGIDHGLVRLGLAVSDPTGLVARELTVIQRKSKQEDFILINKHAVEQQAVAFVIGLPINVELAEQGVFTQADKVRNWIEYFRPTTTLPIILWDETLTSVDARELSIRQKRHRQDPIDDLAARLMLQSYLDAIRDGLAQPPNTAP